MKKILKFPFLLIAILVTVVMFSACQKDTAGDGNTGKQQLTVYLNDDPSHDFTKVLVEILYVEVKIDSSNGHHHGDDDDDDDDHHGHDSYGHWDTLGITPGVYDLLRLRNGVDTLLASGLVTQGRITKIRLTLGDNNEVWTDSTHAEPLTICDNRHFVYANLLSSGVDTLPGGASIIRLDFDIEKSIKRRNGHYCLQPVLKSYCRGRSGGIEGKVLPQAVPVLIKAFNATDTAYAIPWHHGEFKIRGLNPGTYSVLYDALSPFQDTLLTNIQVSRGRETELPDITLHQ